MNKRAGLFLIPSFPFLVIPSRHHYIPATNMASSSSSQASSYVGKRDDGPWKYGEIHIMCRMGRPKGSKYGQRYYLTSASLPRQRHFSFKKHVREEENMRLSFLNLFGFQIEGIFHGLILICRTEVSVILQQLFVYF